MLIQILLTIFIIFALTRIVFKFKQNKLKPTEFFSWALLWLAGLVVVWLPNATTKIANFLGIGRGADLIFYLSLVIIFYLLFKIYLRIENIEKNITKFTKTEAINNASFQKKEKNNSPHANQ